MPEAAHVVEVICTNVVNPPFSQIADVANLALPVNPVAAVNPGPAVTTVNRGRGQRPRLG